MTGLGTRSCGCKAKPRLSFFSGLGKSVEMNPVGRPRGLESLSHRVGRFHPAAALPPGACKAEGSIRKVEYGAERPAPLV